MAAGSDKGTMLTAAKVAKELGVSAGQVKKVIAERRIKPDQVKGACSYYSAATVKQIKAALK